MPLDAIGGDWVVGGGPYDARVSPDGLTVAYWFTGHRRFCLPTEPGCSFQDSDVAAYAHTDRVTDPLELGVVRERRQPSWYGSGRALARSGRLRLRLRLEVRAPGRATARARRTVMLRSSA